MKFFFSLKSLFIGYFLLVYPNIYLAQKLPLWEEGLHAIKTRDHQEKVQIIHFFATWCAPCMVELPVFDSLSIRFPNNKLELTFICLDLKNSNMLGKKISKLNLPGKTYYLEPKQQNLSLIHLDWKGNLPASIIYLPKIQNPKLIEGSKNFNFYSQIIHL